MRWLSNTLCVSDELPVFLPHLLPHGEKKPKRRTRWLWWQKCLGGLWLIWIGNRYEEAIWSIKNRYGEAAIRRIWCASPKNKTSSFVWAPHFKDRLQLPCHSFVVWQGQVNSVLKWVLAKIYEELLKMYIKATVNHDSKRQKITWSKLSVKILTIWYLSKGATRWGGWGSGQGKEGTQSMSKGL